MHRCASSTRLPVRQTQGFLASLVSTERAQLGGCAIRASPLLAAVPTAYEAFAAGTAPLCTGARGPLLTSSRCAATGTGSKPPSSPILICTVACHRSKVPGRRSYAPAAQHPATSHWQGARDESHQTRSCQARGARASRRAQTHTCQRGRVQCGACTFPWQPRCICEVTRCWGAQGCQLCCCHARAMRLVETRPSTQLFTTEARCS